MDEAGRWESLSKFILLFTPDFRKAFLLFDKDGNGRITADELSEVMRTLGQTPTIKEVEAMIQKADQDGEIYRTTTLLCQYIMFWKTLKNSPSWNPTQQLSYEQSHTRVLSTYFILSLRIAYQ